MTTAVDLGYDARTDAGLHRATNEDALLAEPPVFLVADGVGGHASGELASAAVVAAFRELLCHGGPVELVTVRAALREAERRVKAIADDSGRGAGSTVTGVVLLRYEGAPHWLILNVGDSRVYRQFESELEQLTVDHSLAQEEVERGRLSKRRAREAANRNVITRAIGSADARADSWIMPVTTGERLLLCSDGLHSELPDEEIRAILAMTGRPASATAALVDAAKRAGGKDNISVVVVDVRGGGAAPVADMSSRPSASASQGADADEIDDTTWDTVPV
jgi:protein phosphatase